MKAILPGRPQSTRQAVCTAQWDGLRLVAYASGNTVIILRDPKEIIQTLTIDHVDTLTAVVFEETSGRLATCDEQRALIFNAVGREQGDLRWTQAHDIPMNKPGTIRTISWGSQEELLIGGTQLWLYHLPHSEAPRLVWQQNIASEVAIAEFSNDTELIATCGQHDRLVKIWRRLSFELDSTRFDISYLPHPAAVTNLHWRKPWHAEQSLDHLLYTFCADGQIRVWAYSDPHSLSVIQLIATIDTNASIVPRRTSVGSVSRKRFAFILDSRDFSQATEKAIQQSQNRQVDHALEHLVEIANRSPEICVVLDGLGHMSVWGIENAGCKTKHPTVVFNIILVDDVNIQLSFPHAEHQDYVRICSFAGGFSPASLSLLVHSYTGQVDWYESPITSFFDTSTRSDRITLVASWSGHDTTVDHIARGPSNRYCLSWVDEGRGILWSETNTGALRRKSEIATGERILGMILLHAGTHALILCSNSVALWDLKTAHGREIYNRKLELKHPRCLGRIGPLSKSTSSYFAVFYQDGVHETWQICLPPGQGKPSKSNGAQTLLSRIYQTPLEHDHIVIARDIVTDSLEYETQTRFMDVVTITSTGQVHGFGHYDPDQPAKNAWKMETSLETNIREAALARSTCFGKSAVVTSDRKCLYIWDLQHCVCEWQFRCSDLDEIQKLAWTCTPGGHLLLFVSSSFRAEVIGQRRFPATISHQDAWCVVQDINLRDFTTISIGDVCWLSDGKLVIGAGNQIYVLESTRSNSSPSTSNRGQHTNTSQFAVITTDLANSTLPIFHIDLLEALVVEGAQQSVQKILRTLYEKLKYFSEGDELDSDLELSMFDLMSSGTGMASDSVIHTNGDMSFDLEQIQQSFEEYLQNADIWQISAEKCHDISIFLKNFIAVIKHDRSLDENGLRYLYYFYRIPANQDLPWCAFVFASRSNSHEALLDLISRHYDGKITWELARRTGMFVWLSDLNALQTQLENVARTEYNKPEDRNPVDCSLYYLALNKKSVLQGLWRMTIGVMEKRNTMKLLANNFDEPKWKETALKNAYALLSKRRFEYAAAFFLLGNSLKDAVNVCVNQLHDIQLAIAIARVWDKDIDESKQVLDELLHKHILSRAVDDDQGRWIAAWAYTTLGQPSKALSALVRPLYQVIGIDLKKYNGPVQSMSYCASDPHLTILYIQLRDHLLKKNQWTADVLSPREEWQFVLRAATWWSRAGMDVLALRLLRHWRFVPYQTPRDVAVAAMLKTGDQARHDPIATTDTTQEERDATKKKPPPTQFVEPTADSLLDSFGF